ncbi:MAG TPA: Gfo/Idh/MocA family oxidoreductase [Vicinamibacterales bacterium]|nr:Gfo/Idh/MocA family oxidoreductase [Vicinamibacterales bacterium]
MSKVRFGVLSTAKIGTAKVIPAMQRGARTTIAAIASRDLKRAQEAASSLGIPTAYGSYEALIDDPSIDAVYIPLPNHLHLYWTTRAANAGKHVLCEKPLGFTEGDVMAYIETRDRTRVKIQEAFMVRTHPQWLRAREMVRAGRLGRRLGMIGAFSYYNADPLNIRNIAAYGGGALFDIGCYFVMTARFIFGREPTRVMALMDRDPEFETDRLTSMVLDFGGATFVGTCATQMTPFQRIQILGSEARLEVEIPFNAPPDRACKLFFDARGVLGGSSVETIEIEACDQYTIQGDRFAEAIQEGLPEVYPLEESLANFRVIDALFRSAQDGNWVTVTE